MFNCGIYVQEETKYRQRIFFFPSFFSLLFLGNSSLLLEYLLFFLSSSLTGYSSFLSHPRFEYQNLTQGNFHCLKVTWPKRCRKLTSNFRAALLQYSFLSIVLSRPFLIYASSKYPHSLLKMDNSNSIRHFSSLFSLRHIFSKALIPLAAEMASIVVPRLS